MNTGRDFDHTVRDWIAEGPTMLSGQTLAAALAEIHGASQIGRPGPRPWSRFGISRSGRLWAFAVLAVTVVVLAIAILRPPITQQAITVPSPSASPSPTASPTPSESPPPTPSPSPSPTPLSSPPSAIPSPAISASGSASAASPAPGLPIGPLPAGTYRSDVMIPNVTFTTPSNLILRYEKTENVWLATGYALGAPEFNVIRADEKGIVDRLAKEPKAKSTRPASTTVAGLPARTIEISVPEGAYKPQVRNLFSEDAIYVTGLREAQWYVYLLPGSKARVIELTVDSYQVLIFWQAPLEQYPEFSKTAEKILATIEFP